MKVWFLHIHDPIESINGVFKTLDGAHRALQNYVDSETCLDGNDIEESPCWTDFYEYHNDRASMEYYYILEELDLED